MVKPPDRLQYCNIYVTQRCSEVKSWRPSKLKLSVTFTFPYYYISQNKSIKIDSSSIEKKKTTGTGLQRSSKKDELSKFSKDQRGKNSPEAAKIATKLMSIFSLVDKEEKEIVREKKNHRNKPPKYLQRRRT
jgi:hypothetical protein